MIASSTEPQAADTPCQAAEGVTSTNPNMYVPRIIPKSARPMNPFFQLIFEVSDLSFRKPVQTDGLHTYGCAGLLPKRRDRCSPPLLAGAAAIDLPHACAYQRLAQFAHTEMSAFLKELLTHQKGVPSAPACWRCSGSAASAQPTRSDIVHTLHCPDITFVRMWNASTTPLHTWLPSCKGLPSVCGHGAQPMALPLWVTVLQLLVILRHASAISAISDSMSTPQL